MRKRIEAADAGGGQILWCALVPLFAVAEGTHRLISGLRGNTARSRQRGWLDEVQTQAWIATSYALMARSLLHQSERRPRSERLS